MSNTERQKALEEYRAEVDKFVKEHAKIDKRYPAKEKNGVDIDGSSWPPDKKNWKKQAVVKIRSLALSAGMDLIEHNIFVRRCFEKFNSEDGS